MYVNATSARRHIKITHDKSVKYDCTKCNYTTTYSGHLNRHMRLDHYENFKNFEKCPNCGKRLKNLKHHLRRKTCAKKKATVLYDCRKCSKNFTTKFRRDTHTKICGKEYYCDYCARKFHMKHEIRLHIWQKHMNRVKAWMNKAYILNDFVFSRM